MVYINNKIYPNTDLRSKHIHQLLLFVFYQKAIVYPVDHTISYARVSIIVDEARCRRLF